MLLRQRIHETALSEFLAKGYADTTIEGIARAAGVSRTTIYAHYSDKQTLFDGMIRSVVRGADIDAQVAFDDRPPAIVLGEAFRFINRAYYREPNLGIMRLCIAEADRFPALIAGARTVLSDSLRSVAIYLARLRDEGRLRITDCDAAARLFNMLALGTLKPLMVHSDYVTDEDARGHLDMALDIFLRGVLRNEPDTDTETSE